MSDSADPDGANPRYQVAPRPLPALAAVCEPANAAAARAVFAGYRSRLAPLTMRRQTTDLALFGTYLQEQGLPPGALDTEPAAWQGITWGLVEGFVAWQLSAGYAVGTVNLRLATVKAYAKLAVEAGAIPRAAHLLIESVQGYRRQEAQRLDQQRPITRRGSKKAAPLLPTLDQARRLKNQPLDTPTGRRDALLMCLLVDHGLRRGEIYGLRVGCISLEQGTLTFHRPAVDTTQTHELTADTFRAAFHYLTHDAAPSGGLLRPSRKGGALTAGMMSERAITKRAAFLGAAVGLPSLSPQDCRHYWATAAARTGADIMQLLEAGGWSSLHMPSRGDLALARGTFGEARRFFEETLAISEREGNRLNQAQSRAKLATIAILQGRHDEAEAPLSESLAIFRHISNSRGVALVLERYAALASARGETQRAVALCGAATTLHQRIGSARVAFDQNLYTNLLIALRAESAPAHFAAAWAYGETASTEDVLAWRPDLPAAPAPQAVAAREASAADREPLAAVAPAPTEAATPSPNQFGLSEREIVVLQRLARGMTNTEIAASLVLSRFTINAHLRSIYGKLGVSTRTAAARYAIEHKLI